MTFDELVKVASEEKDHEEWLGQLWLERRRILGRVNRAVPRARPGVAREEIALLRRRVEREGGDQGHASVVTCSRPDKIDPKHIIRRF